jgi:ferredoxin
MVREKAFQPRKARIKVHLIGLPHIPVPVYTRKCDACGGEPACVKYCEVDALTYSEDNLKPDKKKIIIPEILAEEWLKQAEDNIK